MEILLIFHYCLATEVTKNIGLKEQTFAPKSKAEMYQLTSPSDIFVLSSHDWNILARKKSQITRLEENSKSTIKVGQWGKTCLQPLKKGKVVFSRLAKLSWELRPYKTISNLLSCWVEWRTNDKRNSFVYCNSNLFNLSF